MFMLMKQLCINIATYVVYSVTCGNSNMTLLVSISKTV